MNCCSNYQYYNEPLFNCHENCIFCLGKSNNQHIFLTYNTDCFKIDNKLYRINCICRPYCHVSCMKSWLNESLRCPECSIYFSDIIEKKQCTFYSLCAMFFSFLCVSIVCLIIISIVVHNKHLL
uniref:RING-type domain-containing protein n=1 Tax=viral metagenome TaxID=1070528 RepID=A0A6C0B446_9ZZZZ